MEGDPILSPALLYSPPSLAASPNTANIHLVDLMIRTEKLVRVEYFNVVDAQETPLLLAIT